MPERVQWTGWEYGLCRIAGKAGLDFTRAGSITYSRSKKYSRTRQNRANMPIDTPITILRSVQNVNY